MQIRRGCIWKASQNMVPEVGAVGLRVVGAAQADPLVRVHEGRARRLLRHVRPRRARRLPLLLPPVRPKGALRWLPHVRPLIHHAPVAFTYHRERNPRARLLFAAGGRACVRGTPLGPWRPALICTSAARDRSGVIISASGVSSVTRHVLPIYESLVYLLRCRCLRS